KRELQWLTLPFIALTALTFAKMRLRLYSEILALPFCLDALFALKRKSSLIAGSLATFALLASHFSDAPPLGFGINSSEFPVLTTRWLENQRPPGRLFNAYDFGGYLILNTPDYPVSQDGRE